MVYCYSLQWQQLSTEYKIKRLFLILICLGLVARIWLKIIKVNSTQSYEDTLKTYLIKIDREISTFNIKDDHQSLEYTLHFGLSHRITIMQPTISGKSYIV